MGYEQNLKDLQDLLNKNGNFVKENLAIANKFIADVPEEKRGALKEVSKDIAEAARTLDKGKVADVIEKLKQYGA